MFLLTNGEKNILIDTSVSRLWGRLQNKIERLGITKIDYLILTHAHFDHAANANRIKAKYGATVIVHEDEADYLAKGDGIVPSGTNFFTRLIVNVLGKLLLPIFRYEPCQPDILVHSEYDLSQLGFNARLIHTPGHTAGSMSLIVDDELAIVGDTMIGVFSWFVFPPFAEDEKLLVKSWNTLLKTSCSVFIPSHGTANSRSLVQKDYDRRNKSNKDERDPNREIAQKIDFKFRQEVLNFILGNNTFSDLPRIGLLGLTEGLESESLIILAGLSETDNSFEIEHYFKKTISELSIELPDKYSASIELAQFYADLIIDRKLDPILGVKEMIWKCFYNCDFGEDKKYTMDNIGFEAVYGLYWTYDDLKNADGPWRIFKSNNQLMIEIKEKIIDELIKWRNKNVLQHRI